MASAMYNSGRANLVNGNIDFLTDTIKVSLHSSSYVPDVDAHEDFADLTNEISGTGYTAGGAALANKAINIDDANDRAEIDADDTTWTNSTISNARYAVVYKDTGTPGTSLLICYIDFAEDKSSNSSDFTIQWNIEGMIQI